MTDELVVAVSCDGNFVRPACVALTSLARNLPDPLRVHLFVLDLGITPYGLQLIERALAPYRHTVLALDNFNLSGLPLSRLDYVQRLDQSVYAFLDLASRLADITNRFLYLDSDVLVVRDVSELWQIDIEEHGVAAVTDFGNPFVSSPEAVPNYAALGLDAQAPALNSGVLVVDPAIWQSRGITERTLEYARTQPDLPLLAQSALNATLAGLWHELNPSFNYQLYPEFEAAYSQGPPHIVHFVGRQKPWTTGAQSAHYQLVYSAYNSLLP